MNVVCMFCGNVFEKSNKEIRETKRDFCNRECYKNSLNPKREIKVAVRDWRKKMKLEAVNYKGSKCERCGYNKCMKALEFHHLDPNEKDFTISHRIKKLENMKVELDKCMLVCANCHREIHDGLA